MITFSSLIIFWHIGHILKMLLDLHVNTFRIVSNNKLLYLFIVGFCISYTFFSDGIDKTADMLSGIKKIKEKKENKYVKMMK